MESLLSLLVQPGERLSAAKWNGLVRAVEQRTLTRGRGVMLSHGPDATVVRFRAGNGSVLPQTPLRVSLSTDSDGDLLATVTKGLIAGLEPQIDGTPVSQLDAKGNPPQFTMDPDKVIDGKTGIGLLYAKLTLRTDWSVQKVEPYAVSAPPPITAWTAFKLLAFLRRTPAADQKGVVAPIQTVFFNLGYTSSQRGSNGKARHWFWAM